MSAKKPQLGEVTPTDYKCTREVGQTFGEGLCGQPAVMHIAWDSTLENSLACARHAYDALTDFEPYDWHDVDHACGVSLTWIASGTPGDSYCADDVHPDLLALSETIDLSAMA